MKKRIIFFLSILILFCNNAELKANTEIKIIKESLNINYDVSQRIIYNIKRELKKTNFNEEIFYLKIKCFINWDGTFKYKLLKESKEGYNNKILIVKRLEEMKRKDFKNDMEYISRKDENYKYKELIFEMEVSN